MNEDRLIALAGTFAIVVFVVMLFGGWWYQRPLSDRTIVLFGALLYATLRIDISSALPINIIPSQSSDDEGGD